MSLTLPLLSLSYAGTALQPQVADPPEATVRAHREAYHGWPDAIVLGNGQVEAIIVPAVGRVMQFRFAGDTDGPFWENRALDGKSAEPSPIPYYWDNFGGDKTWPSPQEEWPRIMSHGWPPPAAFDSMPVDAEITTGCVTLLSAVDPDFGIRATRRVSLEPGRPVMRITTTFEKVRGERVAVGIWTVTQLQHPRLIAAPAPTTPAFPNGFRMQIGQLPPGLKSQEGMLSLPFPPQGSYKLGTESATLLSVGEKWILRIDSPRQPEAEYPDGGCSAEVCVVPESDSYVEMEMLGPLQTLKIGERTSHTSAYSLLRRRYEDPEAEAKGLLREK